MMHPADLLFPEHHNPEMRFIHRGCGLTVRTPSWDDLTVIKPIGPDHCHTAETEAGDSASPDRGWYYGLPDLLRAVGWRGRLTCLNQPIDAAPGSSPCTPYEQLRQTIDHRARLDRPEWSIFFEQLGGYGPALPTPRAHAVIQGALYLRGNQDMTVEPRQRTLLLLSPSAICAVRRVLQSLELLDDLLDPTSDTLLLLYQSRWHYALESRWHLVHEVEQPPQPTEAHPYGAGRYIARLVKPAKSSMIAAPPPTKPVTPTFVPWHAVIHRPTLQTQLRDLCETFPPEVTIAAYRDTRFEPLLPDWVRQRI